MLDWFRSWHGAPTDAKWLVVGKRAGVAPGVVSAIVWAMLDYASQCEERGSVAGFDFETYATFSGFEEEQVRAVHAAMEAKGIIVGGRIAQWEKRQPKREDSSSERMKEIRKKKDAQPSLPLSNEQLPKTEASKPPDPPVNVESPSIEISPEAIELADEVAVIAGHDLKFVPPAWCGAASRVQMWLSAGWSRDLVIQSVHAQMHRKRDGPPDRIKYFERGIAQAIAEQYAPLPTIVPFPGDATHGRNGKTPSPITTAIDRIIADLETGGGAVRKDSSRLLSDRRRQ